MRLLFLAVALATVVLTSALKESCWADVGFLVDESGSIDTQEFDLIQNFLTLTANELVNLVDTEAHLGLGSFSNNEKTHCLFSQHQNTASFIAAVGAMLPRQSGVTRLDLGMRLFAGPCSTSDVASKKCIFGGLGDRSDVLNTLVLITDGRPTSNIQGVSNEDIATRAAQKAGILQAQGHRVIVIAVGINDDDTTEYLKSSIASHPSFFFPINSFEGLALIRDAVLKIICPEVTTKQPDPTVPTTAPAPGDVECRECLARDNQRQFFTYSADCHSYLQCYLNAAGEIVSIVRPCPDGLYWNDQILTCVRDADPGTGPEECLDPCNVALAPGLVGELGSCWFDDVNPCLYYKCANTNSQPHCCPTGTQFALSVCDCTNTTSTITSCSAGSCTLPGPGEDVTVAPVRIDNQCTDRRGRRLAANPQDSTTFFHVLADGSISSIVMHCATDTVFSLDQCDCQAGVNPLTPERLPACMLHLTLNEADGNFKDSSVYKHYVHNRGVSSGNGAYAGSGTFGGNELIEIPAFQTNDFRNAASFCLMFACDGACNGGLLSNSKNFAAAQDKWSIRLSATPQTTCTAETELWHPTSQHSVTSANNGPFAATQFIQACAILRQSVWELWINGVLVDEVATTGGDIAIRHCPLTIGSDHFFGNFTGRIDEVLICPHALDGTQVNYHLTNNIAALRALNLLP